MPWTPEIHDIILRFVWFVWVIFFVLDPMVNSSPFVTIWGNIFWLFSNHLTVANPSIKTAPLGFQTPQEVRRGGPKKDTYTKHREFTSGSICLESLGIRDFMDAKSLHRAARCRFAAVPVLEPCPSTAGGFHPWSLCLLVTWAARVTWADGLSRILPLHRWVFLIFTEKWQEWQHNYMFFCPGKLNPIGSMYGIFTFIWLICMVNVSKYSTHGS